jgi:energy-coupling factor transporter transmembrane protein EcfT
LHPSSALILWLAAVLGVQFLGYAGLAVLCLGVLVLAPAAATRWLAYSRRARWLLLTLWLIIAFNTPGEAFNDLAWAPTYEGIAEANLQAVRLLAILACLAWVFVRLGHDGMVAGLWGLLQPLRMAGLDVERIVVRLSLVLENLQTPPAKGEWKRMLAADPSAVEGREVLHLSLIPWALRDTLLVAISAIGLTGVALL